MTWIPSHQELRDHPKLKRLARLLGASPAHACGHLHFLWYWVLDYAVDGDLSDFDHGDIADAAGWTGDPELFVAALVDCGPGTSKGFLERTRGGKLFIHDWEDHGGSQFRKRIQDAERKRKKRAAEREEPETSTGRPPDMSETSAGQDADMSETSKPAALDAPDMSATRGEERRGQRREDPPKEDAAAVACEADGDPSSSIEQEEQKTPDPTEEDDPTDALLIELWDVPGWQRSPAADRRELERLGREYPRADLATAIGQLRAKARDSTLRGGPAVALVAFAKRLHEQTVPEVRRVPQAVADDEPEGESLSREEQAARARAAGEHVRKLRAGAS